MAQHPVVVEVARGAVGKVYGASDFIEINWDVIGRMPAEMAVRHLVGQAVVLLENGWFAAPAADVLYAAVYRLCGSTKPSDLPPPVYPVDEVLPRLLREYPDLTRSSDENASELRGVAEALLQQG